MIKFTAVWVIVYLVCAWFSKAWASSLDLLDTLRWRDGNLNTRETVWFFLVGILKIGSVVFGAISGIMLVVRF